MAITITGGVQLSGPILLDPTGGSPSPSPSYSFQGSNYGYSSGGEFPGGTSNVIQKFPFSSDGNATDVGDLIDSRQEPAGQSSTASGYVSGGQPGAVDKSVIQKFPFASDSNATDVGDLTVARYRSAGQQY